MPVYNNVKLPHTISTMKSKNFYDTHKSGLDYVLLKQRQKQEERMCRSNTLINLRQVIENTMVDLNAHMDACITIIKNLEQESVQKDPLLLQKIRSQLVILKKELTEKEYFSPQELKSIVEGCDQNIKILISEAKDYNLKAFDEFVGDVHKAMKTCDQLIKQTKQAETNGLMNETILIEYVTKIKRGLAEQVNKIEEHRPMMYPSVPNVEDSVNGDQFKKEDYIKRIDHMINSLDNRLDYLAVKQKEFAQNRLLEEEEKRKSGNMPIIRRFSTDTNDDELNDDELNDDELNDEEFIETEQQQVVKTKAELSRKPSGSKFIN